MLIMWKFARYIVVSETIWYAMYFNTTKNWLLHSYHEKDVTKKINSNQIKYFIYHSFGSQISQMFVICLHMNLVHISVSNCRKSPVAIVPCDIGESFIKLRDINRFCLQRNRNVAMGS